MAVTNTKFKVTDRNRRAGGTAEHGDDVTQPRVLQAVAADTDVTTANGFTAANLIPGDLLPVIADATRGNAPALWIRNSANDGWFYSAGGGLVVEHHTAGDTLTSAESGSVHTNKGASGEIILELPQDAEAGTHYYFTVLAAQTLKINPGAAGAIYYDGAKLTDDFFIAMNDEGEFIHLCCDGDNDWFALASMDGVVADTVVET